MRNNKKLILACLLCVLVSCFTLAEALAKEPDSNVLVGERTAVCYIEGEVFDDLILGSRGVIQFVYLDSKLSKALSKAHADIAGGKTPLSPFPQWIEQNHSYFAKEGKQGKVVFMAELESFRPWDFDPSEVFIGNYHLTKNDILSPSMTNPFGELPSGMVGDFVFVVPASEVKPGTEINIGYGEYSVKWKVPK